MCEKVPIYAMSLLLFAFCSILLKTKNNVKNTLFASMLVTIGQNNQIFVKDCYFYQNILSRMSQIKWPLLAN